MPWVKQSTKYYSLETSLCKGLDILGLNTSSRGNSSAVTKRQLAISILHWLQVRNVLVEESSFCYQEEGLQ